MPLPEPIPVGAPCWIDLMTSDPDGAESFYGRLFGWEAESAGDEFGGYINFSKDGQRVAGGMRNDGQSGAPEAWTVYLRTADAKATVDAAQARGGQVIVSPMDVADLGTMAVVTDAGGAAVGMWQAGSFAGFEVLTEPGSPAWFELQTRAYDSTVDFYRDVFAWDTHAMSDTPEFRYTTFGEGDSQRAGIVDASAFLPDGMPAHWAIYFRVADTDAALVQIEDLGGAVLTTPENTPYGRIAAAADPTGAAFRLMALI